jgi:hypothetical protein
MPESRQQRPEGKLFGSAMATVTLAVGTSIALSRPLPPRPTQPEYNFEAAVSPVVRDLKREMGLVQKSLLAHHTATDDNLEVIEVQVDRSYISRATAAAALAPHVALNTDDYNALMATPTYSPRSLDIDYDEE